MRLMISSGKLKTVGRVASLVLLLVVALGPWFIDSHPATEESCSPPLVWLGNGYCACLVSLKETLRMASSPGHHMLWLVCLPPALPFLSTLLLILSRERRWLWISHLVAWGLVAIFSLFLFVAYLYRHPALILWGAGISGVVAVAILVGEILVDKSQILNESP
jgi:hypothetical protein